MVNIGEARDKSVASSLDTVNVVNEGEALDKSVAGSLDIASVVGIIESFRDDYLETVVGKVLAKVGVTDFEWSHGDMEADVMQVRAAMLLFNIERRELLISRKRQRLIDEDPTHLPGFLGPFLVSHVAGPMGFPGPSMVSCWSPRVSPMFASYGTETTVYPHTPRRKE